MKKATLFIVDDDALLTEMLTDYLKDAFPHFAIRSFSTGEECLKHLDESPDIVVLDYYLNSREKEAANGIDILKEIKSLSRSLPVIMLSSQKNYSVAAHSIEYGAIHYVTKGQKAFGEVRKIIAANI
jgi:DNA-binding NtrC family response regulator